MGVKNSKLNLPQDIKGRFSEGEINEWYNEFKHHCRRKNGEEYLTKEDFLGVYNKVFPGDCSDYVRHLFRTFDTNDNGKVDFREFLIGLHESDDVEKRLSWAFKVYDVSNNGEISKPEMGEIVRSVYKMLDLCTVSLPKESATPELVVERMFRQMDGNNDGSLTWEEFRDGVMKDPFLLDLLQVNPTQGEQDSSHFAPH